MNKKTIDDFVLEELSSNDQKTALDFLKYLRKNEVLFVKGDGHWKDKIYYLVKIADKYVCFISINDPDDKNNRWTVWSDDIKSLETEDLSIKEEIKETAWKYVDSCGNCGSCNGGKRKVIFGKEFDNVCGCTFRIDNPTENELEFMKIMVDTRIKEILH